MESGNHMMPLLNQNRLAKISGQDLHLFTRPQNHRRTYENRLQGLPCKIDSGDAAVDLPSIGVSLDSEIYQSERALGRIQHFFGKQDRARTGAEDRAAVPKVPEWFKQAFNIEQPEHGRAFAPREYQAIHGD